MIAEILLILAGHESSLFVGDYTLHESFAPFLHPGERQCVEALGKIAHRYRKLKAACQELSRSPSRYICALSSTLDQILQDNYETLVVDTEEKILRRDPALVGRGSFVPLSSIRAIFAEWDAPMDTLYGLSKQILSQSEWKPGTLIDSLQHRSKTGVRRISDIFQQLSRSVQRVWRTQIIAFMVHGTLPKADRLISSSYTPLPGAIPSFVSKGTVDSIIYVGRAVSMITRSGGQKQLPSSLLENHASLLQNTLPEDHHSFDAVVAQVRANVSEWIWLNILTQRDVEQALESLANYFLLRDGEFGLALIREVERLKISRLTMRSSQASVIKEQDLNLAMLRASLGTMAQHDPTLSRLSFSLPDGPLRPLLPSLTTSHHTSTGIGASGDVIQVASSMFNAHILGTPLVLNYRVSWPLDIVLQSSELDTYACLFSYLSALRKTHNRVHNCWTALSNSQRSRRRWTGLGEGGTDEDLNARKQLLRCGWGVVRDMSWFLDTIMGYTMTDVVEVEFRRLRNALWSPDDVPSTAKTGSNFPASSKVMNAAYLDFTTLRESHASYLERLLTGCLLTDASLTIIIQRTLNVCERFAAHVERWGDDVLPALLFEGSLKGGETVGEMVKSRQAIVAQINSELHEQFGEFYEYLHSSMSQPTAATSDGSKSTRNASMPNFTAFNFSKASARLERTHDIRRHVERLLLRLDFNGRFSKIQWDREMEIDSSFFQRH